MSDDEITEGEVLENPKTVDWYIQIANYEGLKDNWHPIGMNFCRTAEEAAQQAQSYTGLEDRKIIKVKLPFCEE